MIKIPPLSYKSGKNNYAKLYIYNFIDIFYKEGDILCQLLFKKSKNSVFIIDKQFYCSLTFPDYRVFYFSS